MSKTDDILAQGDKLLQKIRKIDIGDITFDAEKDIFASVIEAKIFSLQNLASEALTIIDNKREAGAQLHFLKAKLDNIQAEIERKALPFKEKIFAVAGERRWFWFGCNRDLVLFDWHTGLLWACLRGFSRSQLDSARGNDLTIFDNARFKNWQIPTYDQFREMISDLSYPDSYPEGIDVDGFNP